MSGGQLLLGVTAGVFALTSGGVQGQTLTVGNLVYLDANGNRVADAGEGVAGVTVQLFEEGDEPGEASPVQATETGPGGVYGFSGVAEGTYFIHVPAVEFLPGGELNGALNLPGQAGLAADDDVGEDGMEEGGDAMVDGIRSDIFDLAQDSAPTGMQFETGFQAEADDEDDANGDLTIDLGFYRPVGVGNRVFLDANSNGVADSGEGLSGVEVRLYRDGAEPAVDEAEAVQVTGANGSYLFLGVVPGAYFVQVPAAEFGAGRPLAGAAPLPGTSPLADDDAGEDTLPAAQPEVTGVRTETFVLERGTMPTTTSPSSSRASAPSSSRTASTATPPPPNSKAASPSTTATPSSAAVTPAPPSSPAPPTTAASSKPSATTIATSKCPPKGALTATQVHDLETWIQNGAPDPRPPPSQTPPTKQTGLSLEQGRQFWSFQPLASPALPPVQNTTWPRTPVDTFILAELEKHHLSPSPPANRHTLIRRATFDLTGLPPTPAEITTFLADDSPDAFRHLIDRLLASPQYGERYV